MSRPVAGRHRTGATAGVVVLIVVLVALRLWVLDAREGGWAVAVTAAAVVLVGGGLALEVWRQWSVSGERLAAAARAAGLMNGSVWYSAASPLDAPRTAGLLVLRRDAVTWLPAGLDPSAARSIPVAGATVRLDSPTRTVEVWPADGRIERYRVHSTKSLPVALGTVGVATPLKTPRTGDSSH